MKLSVEYKAVTNGKIYQIWKRRWNDGEGEDWEGWDPWEYVTSASTEEAAKRKLETYRQNERDNHWEDLPW